MEAGDADTAKAATMADAENQELVAVLVGMVGNVNKLRDAAKSKFGEEAGSQLAGNMKTGDMAKQLEESEVKEEGETASITNAKSPQNSVKLKKVSGEWKVDMAGSAGGSQITQQLPFLKAVGAAMGDLATEITDGKYKTVEEAQGALQTKMMGAMAAMRRPTTSAPATQPAK
jgi:hypothetical protein